MIHFFSCSDVISTYHGIKILIAVKAQRKVFLFNFLVNNFRWKYGRDYEESFVAGL